PGDVGWRPPSLACCSVVGHVRIWLDVPHGFPELLFFAGNLLRRAGHSLARATSPLSVCAFAAAAHVAGASARVALVCCKCRLFAGSKVVEPASPLAAHWGGSCRAAGGPRLPAQELPGPRLAGPFLRFEWHGPAYFGYALSVHRDRCASGRGGLRAASRAAVAQPPLRRGESLSGGSAIISDRSSGIAVSSRQNLAPAVCGTPLFH